MAGLLDLFSGRSSDIYGQGLLTPEQRGGLGNIGLLALAGKLGQLAGPSFSPVPDFGAALGQAAGAYGASQEGAGTAALNAILTGQKGRKLEQELDYYKQLGPILGKLAGQWPGADGGAGGGEGSGSTGGGAAAPPGAGGGGGGPGRLSYDQVHQLVLDQGFPPDKAPTMTAIIMAESGGNPGAKNLNPSDPGGSYGLTQINQGAHGPKALEALNNPVRAIQLAYDISNGGTNFAPWSAYKSGVYKQFLRQPGADGAAAPTAASPAGRTDGAIPPGTVIPPGFGAGGLLNFTTGRAGLLGGTADAGDTTAPAAGSPAARKPSEYLATLPPGINDQTPQQQHLANLAAGGRGLFPPGTKFNRNGSPISGDLTATLPGQQSGANIPPAVARSLGASRLYGGSGSSAAASEDIYAGDSEPRGPAGDPGPAGPTAMVSGLLAPGGPLTRGGVPGMPAMPPAAAPSVDPSLQLGPLATPAPAAAAPAAPGPGLLSPPGALPAAPALPRVNPAFDAYARQLAVAQGLATGAGLPNALGPLLEAFKSSPAYKAQQIIAEKGAAQPFEQAQTLFNKQVEIAGVGPIEAAKLPYALAKSYFDAEQQIRTAGPVAAAQNFERIRADNAAKGIITTRDADGQIRLSIDPDAVKAVTGATITAPEQAKADIARETTRIQQEQQARYEPMPGGVPVMGADGKTTMMPMSRYEYDLRQRLQQERRGAGAPASSPQPGDIVGTPYVTDEEKASQASDQKRLDTMQTTAEASRLAIQNANDIRQLVEKGVVMGPGESVRSQLLKLGYALKLTGKDDNDLIANTETFISRQGAELKDALKGLGPPISNIDVQTAGGIAGGKNLTPQGLLELMQIKEKYHRQALNDYNQLAEKAPPSRYPRSVKEPPTYGAQMAVGPNGEQIWKNPTTGKWMPY